MKKDAGVGAALGTALALAAALACPARPGVARAGELAAGGAAATVPDRYPTAGASYLVMLDGRPLWARAPEVPRAPASLTKLLTALLAVEADPEGEAWVKVSARAAAATGSRLGLRAGDELRLGDLLTATLVSSSNDACLALAEHVGGGAGAFVGRMNRRARQLGLTGSHFEDPCGHDRPGHVSTASDLLRLARAALTVPRLRYLVTVERARVVTRAGRALDLRTHNAFLGRVAGARGVKTGYTQGAGSCLVALVERGGRELWLVLLDAPDRWWTAAALVEAAFEQPVDRGS